MLRNRNIWGLILAVLAVFAASGCKKPEASASPPPATVNIAAAADLKFALDAIIAEFQKANPNITVTANYGSSGNFYSQLSNKAPV